MQRHRTKRKKTALRTAGLCIIAAAAGSATSQAAFAQDREYRYAVFDLGDFGGDASNAFGINDDGTVVGCAWFPGNIRFHPALFSTDGPPVDLGTFGGSEGTCYEINNAGVVTGYAYDELGRARAFLFENEILHELGTLGGSGSIAHAINEGISVVGFSSLPVKLSHGFQWSDGIMSDLGSLGGESKSSQVWDINESGQIVGYSSKDTLGATAVIWQSDGMLIDLNELPGGLMSEAYAINDLGNIVGWSTDSDRQQNAVLWDSHGNIYNLEQGHPGFGGETAFGINNNNEVVGRAIPPSGDQQEYAFIWDPANGMRFLDTLVPPRIGLRIWVGFDINERGQIAAWGEQFKTRLVSRAVVDSGRSRVDIERSCSGCCRRVEYLDDHRRAAGLEDCLYILIERRRDGGAGL